VKKIAVVEDNPDNRLLVRVILDSLYDVTEYETGSSALEGLQTDKPDLLLLDVSYAGNGRYRGAAPDSRRRPPA
jgi:CheY-like chemotaxis protein